MKGIKIIGTGHSVPEVIVTNDDLGKVMDTNDEWIRSRTGIAQRHNIPQGEGLTKYAAQAAEKAIVASGINREEIGAVIVATLSAENLVPATACLLQEMLGLSQDILAFDLNAACSGFIYALHTMECLLNASPKKYGLVIGCEHLSRLLDMNDRGTGIIFGDGAAAAIVEASEETPSIQAMYGCKGNYDMLYCPGARSAEPSFIHMDGANVFKFAVSTIPMCIDAVLEKTGMSVEDVDFFVFHQANARIIDLVVRKYKIPEEKYYKNIAEYGNTSAASIPLVISELVEKQLVHPGSRVLVVGFGAGLTWGGALVNF